MTRAGGVELTGGGHAVAKIDAECYRRHGQLLSVLGFEPVLNGGSARIPREHLGVGLLISI
jgi:hypothetical protein